ncbi:hypothetical protein PT273_05165 [Orbaceae bacterium ESL0727]|nr:hypothetical protein [Orbaceae bacterium ESL0727]
MNIFELKKSNEYEKIDPLFLFEELSKFIDQPISSIIKFFIRNHDDDYVSSRPETSFEFYEYDDILGFEEIYNYSSKKEYLMEIANGAKRVIETNGLWGLVKNGSELWELHNPFYFKRSEVKKFLNFYKMPLPPCITKKMVQSPSNDLYDKTLVNNIDEPTQNNDKLQEQINQLKQELERQKKVNDNFVTVPFYKDNDDFLKDYKQGKHHPTNDHEQELTAENKQLKINNQKLIEQLNEAKKEIEILKQPTDKNNQPESPKTINAQARFIKALLYITYGADIANNPRPSIDGASDDIRRDFEAKGLDANLPSGVTVKQWVDSVDLK